MLTSTFPLVCRHVHPAAHQHDADAGARLCHPFRVLCASLFSKVLLNALGIAVPTHSIAYGCRDIAYNLEDDCGQVGDAFSQDVEAIATRVPYMYGPGNHEDEEPTYSYAQYVNRYVCFAGNIVPPCVLCCAGCRR